MSRSSRSLNRPYDVETRTGAHCPFARKRLINSVLASLKLSRDALQCSLARFSVVIGRAGRSVALLCDPTSGNGPAETFAQHIDVRGPLAKFGYLCSHPILRRLIAMAVIDHEEPLGCPRSETPSS